MSSIPDIVSLNFFAANLPEEVVNGLPAGLETGIYYGLSNVNSGEVYKTVLSIGWNPFYNNTKKSLVR